MKRHAFGLVAGLAAVLVGGTCLAADAPEAAKAVTAPAVKAPALTDLYKSIAPKELGENPIRLIGEDWMLITAGTPEKFNSMTASWGGYGMWKKPVTFILVNPSRYTFQFIEKEEVFTLSFYDPARYRDVLGTTFGRKSGRDIDKVKESGFTPIQTNPGIAYAEARMIIVCKKTFNTNTDPEGKAHRLYFGEIVGVWVRK
jgi:flavin reductase (DIM6/NTAB) family NADH-FMN oxidoreductase RutF